MIEEKNLLRAQLTTAENEKHMDQAKISDLKKKTNETQIMKKKTNQQTNEKENYKIVYTTNYESNEWTTLNEPVEKKTPGKCLIKL